MTASSTSSTIIATTKKSLSDAYQKSNSAFLKTINPKKEAAAPMDTVKSVASDVYRQGKKQAGSVTKFATNVARSAVSESKTTTAVVDSLKTKSKAVSGQVQRATKKAMNDASISIKGTTKKAFKSRAPIFASSIHKTSKKAVRWFWLWSLTAIGVYGIATTVPKEMIRSYSSLSENNNGGGK